MVSNFKIQMQSEQSALFALIKQIEPIIRAIHSF